jgi:hypothetical protein
MLSIFKVKFVDAMPNSLHQSEFRNSCVLGCAMRHKGMFPIRVDHDSAIRRHCRLLRLILVNHRLTSQRR